MSTITAPYEGTVKGNGTLTIEEAEKYIRNWDKWKEFIPEEILYDVIQKVKKREVIGVHYTPGESSWHAKRYEVEERVNKMRFEEWKGEWKRDVYLDAVGYRVPYSFQNVHLNSYWKACLLRAFPYLCGYEFDAYAPDGGVNTVEIYVRIQHGSDGQVTSVYVPVKALKEKDPTLIEKRHFDYHIKYAYGDKAWLEKTLPVLDSKEFEEFKAKVKKGE